MKLSAFFSVAVLAVFVQSASAMPVLIDDFTAVQDFTQTGNGTSSASDVPGGAFSDRTLSVTISGVHTTPEASARLQSGVSGSFELYNFVTGSDAPPLPESSFSMLYENLAPVGLTGGNNAFVLTAFSYSSAAPLTIRFTVNGTSTSDLVLPAAAGSFSSVLLLDFASFSDPSQFFLGVTSLKVEGLLAPGAKNFSLDKISADNRDEFAPFVPEPSTLALACMGIAGLGGYGRRRMKARA